MHIHCRGKTQAFSGGSIRSRLSSEVVQFLCIFLMPINMLAAMATAIAIIHVISAPINASDKPLLTFGPRLEALLLQPQCVILRPANLCICEHFSLARPGCRPLCAGQDPDRAHLLSGRHVDEDFISAGSGKVVGRANKKEYPLLRVLPSNHSPK